jgi:hypothetical protein
MVGKLSYSDGLLITLSIGTIDANTMQTSTKHLSLDESPFRGGIRVS